MSDTIYFKTDLTPRDQQIKGLDFVKDSINDGNKFILLNLPTGSGKSLLAIMIANWYKNNINKGSKFDIITNSKILQDQYIRDFNYIENLKGMSNYRCEFHRTDCGTGKEINKVLKRICHNCPYDVAKRRWMESDISITNFALYISMVLYTENIDNKGSNVLIIDEAHDFESVFSDHISVKLNKNKLKKLGFNQVIIDKYDKFFNKIKTIPTFVKFVKEILIRDINNSIDNYKEMMTGEEDKSTISIYSKYIDYSNSQLEVIQNFLEDFDDNKDNWSLDILKDKENGIQLIMQPIWAYSYLDKVVWKKYDHVIFMSGTILDKEMFSYINGLDKESTSYIEMDSTFDVKNRQIYYIKVGKMTYNERKRTFDNQVSIIKKILTKYKKSKGIIHTVNYEITEWLKDLVKDRRLLFHNGENRDEMYNKFIKSKSAKVMVSPSMMTGIDLKHDLSRFSIMLKIPYPNISSNKIKSRQDSNREWYSYKSVCDIIQTYGRTIRSETDYSDTFILDESFSNILKYNSKYLPRYFTEAIKVLK